MNTVGWAFMYEVLCTCMTAPLEGLLVDKAKYSENVGHHLVCWKNGVSRTEESREKKESRRYASADPM